MVAQDNLDEESFIGLIKSPRQAYDESDNNFFLRLKKYYNVCPVSSFDSIIEFLLNNDRRGYKSLANIILDLKNYEQREDKHPEGNVFNHTKICVEKAIKTKDIDLIVAALFHDIGKNKTWGIHPKLGFITYYNHEKESVKIVKKHKSIITEILGADYGAVYFIVKNHMRAKNFRDMRDAKKNKLKESKYFDKLMIFVKEIDNQGDEMKIKANRKIEYCCNALARIYGNVSTALLLEDGNIATPAICRHLLNYCPYCGTKTKILYKKSNKKNTEEK